ncbi:MAG: proprotein convertase P-domain-containing protein [Deltaproteobacteria bacterium]|nr:proprotein convertase P-domain-containing protein [Deltaproteobacteria bacterium]
MAVDHGLAKVAGSGDYKDLAGTPKLADVATTGNYGDLANLPKLAKVAASGAYADLTGAPVLAKVGEACGTNLVMRGIKADGSYDCVAGGLTADQLPKDGLDEISNGLLTNQFSDTFASTKTPLDIPDAQGVGVSDTITVPDLGLAQGIAVAVDLTNSDISKVRVTLFGPGGTQYTLYDQGKSGNALKGSWPNPDKVAAGDLSAWNGKNPQGIWSLNVADLAGTQGGKDGKLNMWSLTVKSLSSKKVAAEGTLVANAGLKLTVAASHPVACSAAQMGYTYVNSKDMALYVCNGQEWYPLALSVFGTQANPALHCNELKAKQPTAPSGVYWIDPDGGSAANALQTYCDMISYGGGWTLVARMTNGCMTDGNGAVGALTSPSQATCAKLSDAAINAIRTAGGSGGVFWGYHDNGNYKLPASGRFLKIVSGSFDANKSQGGLQQQRSCQPTGPWSNPYGAHGTMSGVYNHSGGGWECVTAGQNACDNTTVFSSGLFLYQHALNQAGTFPSNSHGVGGGSNGWLFVR